MTSQWQDSYGDDPTIIQIEGTPFPNKDGILSKSEKNLFARLRDWLFPVVNEDAGDCFVNEEMEQAFEAGNSVDESNQAAVLVGDAAETALKADIDRALTSPEPDATAQMLFKQIDDLQDYLEDEEDSAFAELIEGDDRAMQQVERIREILNNLRLRKNTIVKFVGKGNRSAMPDGG